MPNYAPSRLPVAAAAVFLFHYNSWDGLVRWRATLGRPCKTPVLMVGVRRLVDGGVLPARVGLGDVGSGVLLMALIPGLMLLWS